MHKTAIRIPPAEPPPGANPAADPKRARCSIVIQRPNDGRGLAFAIVKFASRAEAHRALRATNGRPLALPSPTHGGPQEHTLQCSVIA